MMSTDGTRFGIRGTIFDFFANPKQTSNAVRHFEDGLMIICAGRIEAVAPADESYAALKDTIPIYEYPNCLICPGFIDSHVHYAQTRVIGSPASDLLEWLEKYTFPEELQFIDSQHCTLVANEFFDELARNGTTTAQVYPTVHEISTEVFFQEAQARGMRMVGGKVLMDRNAPDKLLDGSDWGERATERLIDRWHENGRQTYSITLRFAGTSTRAQLDLCRRLVEKYPELLFHTHLSETAAEIEWTLRLFPECADYLGVYEKYGVVTDHSVFAHCVHLSTAEKNRLADAGAVVALCPTSNTFLGSGLAPLNTLADHGIGLSLGTDVGGGTSFSMLQTMHEMYKVVQLGGDRSVDALELFYLATLGGAQALQIDDHVGNFADGKEADFVILDSGGQLLMAQKSEWSRSLVDKLFAYIILGNSVNIKETWSMGRCIYRRDKPH